MHPKFIGWWKWPQIGPNPPVPRYITHKIKDYIPCVHFKVNRVRIWLICTHRWRVNLKKWWFLHFWLIWDIWDCGRAQNSERITLQHSYHMTEMRPKCIRNFPNFSEMHHKCIRNAFPLKTIQMNQKTAFFFKIRISYLLKLKKYQVLMVKSSLL